MTIFPAVDIQDGKAVRLRQGRKDDVDIFADDPLQMAQEWQNQGAKWLHIVDLDGAFSGKSVNLPLVSRMARELAIPFQVGGGIRSVETAARYLEAGASRLIIGTAALEDRNVYEQMCGAFPGRIGVSLDACAGRLKSRGWVRDTGLAVEELLPWLGEAGTAFIVYTDIERDGMRSGVNMAALESLLDKAPCPVLVAGGVSDMRDVKALAALKAKNLEGFVSGRALYERSLNLPETLEYLKSHSTRA